jgi:GT2 family glycosyltransferase/glycosyltransferase involved in cell wall biosynthesis/SAM-dependent methyltransferase
MDKDKNPPLESFEHESDSPSSLNFSGERIIPGKVDPDLYAEHLVRYLCAQKMCDGLTVLDTACGVGYGSFHLAQKARRVVGIDNSKAAISFARQHYSLPNIEFVIGNCIRLPFLSETFDLITSFELIEHLTDPEAYLAEVHRVMRKNGLFVVSTPNRPVYSQHRKGIPNPFHIREYNVDEFLLLLCRHFPCVRPLGEVHVPAIGVFGYPIGAETACEVLQSGSLQEADYLVCICSHRERDQIPDFVLVPSSANVLDDRNQHIRSLEEELLEIRGSLGRLQAEFDAKAAWAERLNSEVSGQRARIAQLQKEHDEKSAWAERLNSEILERRARVDELQSALDIERARTTGFYDELRAARGQIEEQRGRIEILTGLWLRATKTKRALLFAIAPLDWLVGLLITFAELLGRGIRELAPKMSPTWPPPDTTRCSLIVLSWDGMGLLAESLPALLRAVEKHGGDHEIIVLDNGSTDGTEEFVRQNYPKVRVVRSPRNLFFSRGNNLGVSAATRDIVVLLNNDMIVDRNFLAPLLAAFDQADVFSVASQVFFADPTKRREETGKTRGYFADGQLVLSHDEILPTDEKLGTVPVLYAGGGAAAFDRRKFLWLGGFDDLWDPFYYEDTDLSFRAWKTGWKCFVAVNSHVLHKHRATNAPRYGRAYVENIVRRNSYIFLWKNFSSLSLLWSHFQRSAAVRVRRAGEPGVGIRFELLAYLRSLLRLPLTLGRKLAASRSFVLSDEDVLEMAASPNPESITEPEIDFRKGSFQEYIGTGWHALEADSEGGYRWMASKAKAYLRPLASGGCEFSMEGYIPPLARYGASKLHLTIRIGVASRAFTLREGVFSVKWELKDLQPNSVQKIDLAADHCIRQTSDNRQLAVLVRRLGFKPTPIGGLRKALLDLQDNPSGKSAPSLGGRSKRVLFISAFAPIPNTHAGGQRVLRIISGLSRFHEITLLTFLEEEKEKERLSPVRKYCREVIPIVRPRFPHAYDPWGIKPRSLETEYNCPVMRELVRDAAFSGRFDLLQFEFLQMSMFLPEHSPTPTLMTHHEIQSLSLSRQLRQLPRFSAQWLKLSRQWMQMIRYELTHLPQFTRVIVLTKEDRTYLRRFDPSLRLIINPTGVDCAYFQPLNEPDDPHRVVFVGYFGHEPNVDGANWLITRILPKVVRRFPNVRLSLVGNAPPDRIKDHANGCNVEVTGWVPDIRPYLGRCAVFVAPLRLGAGIRGKVQEAWAMKRAVVCTTVASAGIRAQNERNLLIADDDETFAEQICRVLADNSLRERLGKAGLETVKACFDWEKTIQQHNAIYQEI